MLHRIHVAAFLAVFPGVLCLYPSCAAGQSPALSGTEVSPGPSGREPSQGKKTMTRDERYRALITDFQRFKAIRKQQPGNVPALVRELSRLREHVAALRKAVDGKAVQEKGPEPVRETVPKSESESQVASSPAPKKPVRSSDPAAEDLLEKRLEMLEKTHLPGRSLEPRSIRERSLADVPDEWIREQCDLADVRLIRLLKLAKASPLDRKRSEESLLELEVIFSGLDEPPRKAKPGARPRSSRP